jgi:hypothetical protein
VDFNGQFVSGNEQAKLPSVPSEGGINAKGSKQKRKIFTHSIRSNVSVLLLLQVTYAPNYKWNSCIKS